MSDPIQRRAYGLHVGDTVHTPHGERTIATVRRGAAETHGTYEGGSTFRFAHGERVRVSTGGREARKPPEGGKGEGDEEAEGARVRMAYTRIRQARDLRAGDVFQWHTMPTRWRVISVLSSGEGTVRVRIEEVGEEGAIAFDEQIPADAPVAITRGGIALSRLGYPDTAAETQASHGGKRMAYKDAAERGQNRRVRDLRPDDIFDAPALEEAYVVRSIRRTTPAGWYTLRVVPADQTSGPEEEFDLLGDFAISIERNGQRLSRRIRFSRRQATAGDLKAGDHYVNIFSNGMPSAVGGTHVRRVTSITYPHGEDDELGELEVRHVTGRGADVDEMYRKTPVRILDGEDLARAIEADDWITRDRKSGLKSLSRKRMAATGIERVPASSLRRGDLVRVVTSVTHAGGFTYAPPWRYVLTVRPGAGGAAIFLETASADSRGRMLEGHVYSYTLQPDRQVEVRRGDVDAKSGQKAMCHTRMSIRRATGADLKVGDYFRRSSGPVNGWIVYRITDTVESHSPAYLSFMARYADSEGHTQEWEIAVRPTEGVEILTGGDLEAAMGEDTLIPKDKKSGQYQLSLRMSFTQTTAAALRIGDYFRRAAGVVVYHVLDEDAEAMPGSTSYKTLRVRYGVGADMGSDRAERWIDIPRSDQVIVLTGSDLTKAMEADGAIPKDQKSGQHQLSIRKATAADLRVGDYWLFAHLDDDVLYTVTAMLPAARSDQVSFRVRFGMTYGIDGHTPRYGENEFTLNKTERVKIITGAELTRAMEKDGFIPLDKKSGQYQLSLRRAKVDDLRVGDYFRAAAGVVVHHILGERDAPAEHRALYRTFRVRYGVYTRAIERDIDMLRGDNVEILTGSELAQAMQYDGAIPKDAKSGQYQLSRRKATMAALRVGDYFLTPSTRIVRVCTAIERGERDDIMTVKYRVFHPMMGLMENEGLWAVWAPIDIVDGTDLAQALEADKVPKDAKTGQYQLSRRKATAGDLRLGDYYVPIFASGMRSNHVRRVSGIGLPQDRENEITINTVTGLHDEPGDAGYDYFFRDDPVEILDGTDLAQVIEKDGWIRPDRKSGQKNLSRRRLAGKGKMSLAEMKDMHAKVARLGLRSGMGPEHIQAGDILKLRPYGMPESFWLVESKRNGAFSMVALTPGLDVPGGGIFMGYDEMRRAQPLLAEPPYPPEVQRLLQVRGRGFNAAAREAVRSGGPRGGY